MDFTRGFLLLPFIICCFVGYMYFLCPSTVDKLGNYNFTFGMIMGGIAIITIVVIAAFVALRTTP